MLPSTQEVRHLENLSDYLYDRPLLTSTTTTRNASSENFQTKLLKAETTI